MSRRLTLFALTPKEENFCLAYLELGSAVDAYIRSSPGTKAKRAVSRVRASEMLRKPHIAARIEELRKEQERQLHDRFFVTKERVLQEIARVGFANIREIVDAKGELRVKSLDELTEDQAACIASIHTTTNGSLKVTFNSKMSALEAMAKHLGMFTEKVELTGKDGEALVPEGSSSREVARAILDIFREAQSEKPSEG